jgi:hypothetical protein
MPNDLDNNPKIQEKVIETLVKINKANYNYEVDKILSEGIKALNILGIEIQSRLEDPEFDAEAAEIAYLLGARVDLDEIKVSSTPNILNRTLNISFYGNIK